MRQLKFWVGGGDFACRKRDFPFCFLRVDGRSYAAAAVSYDGRGALGPLPEAFTENLVGFARLPLPIVYVQCQP